MVIAFVGHSEIPVSKELEKAIMNGAEKYISGDKICFYCGQNGLFDLTCIKVIKELKRRYSNVEGIIHNCDTAEQREEMIDKADLILAHINHCRCEAYNDLKYAMKKKKRIITI